MKIIKCAECGIEIEAETEKDYYQQNGLILCMDCVEDYAYCKSCGKMTFRDMLDNDYVCEKCRKEESKETRIEGDMEFYKAVFNLDYESIASWSKCGSILFQREIMFRVKRACFWLEKFEEERAKKPEFKMQSIENI
jgi:hypothetical protein